MTDPITLAAAGTFSRVGDRDVRGLLLPYDEASRMSASGAQPIRFAKGTVALPRDPSIVTLHVEHDQFSPIGRATVLEDTPAGVVATFRIADTDEGDAYLAAPEKRRLSAELRDIVRRGVDGLSAKLTGSGLVSEGAFASAALFALGEVTEEAAADAQPDTDAAAEPDHTPLTADDSAAATITTDATAPEDTEPAAPANPEEDAVNAATATGFAAAQPTATTEQNALTLNAFFSAIETAKASGDLTTLQHLQGIHTKAMFALQDVTYETGTGSLGSADVIVKKDYLGELWQGNDYERKYIPLFNSAPLRALEWRGWKWTTKPKVEKWGGNKALVPSTKPAVEATSGKAQRFAGGNDIAREFYDFNDTEAIEAVIKALVESYAMVSDLYVLETVKAAATALTIPVGEALPEGISEAHYKIITGALAVVAAKATPSFALVAMDVFKELALTPKDKTPEYLNFSVTLEDGSAVNLRITPSPDLLAGEVLVGAKRAVVVRELPGTPIRVNALDIVKGGVDEAVFGYVGVDVQYAAALQLVTRATA